MWRREINKKTFLNDDDYELTKDYYRELRLFFFFFSLLNYPLPCINTKRII